MNENQRKLVDLNVDLKLLQKRYDESTDEAEVADLEIEIIAKQEEIKAVEDEIAKEEQPAVEEPKVEEPKFEEPKVEEPKEPTSDEVRKSPDWVKVDKNNVKQIFNQESRGGLTMNKDNLEQRKAFMDAIYTRNFSKVEKREVTNSADVEIVIPQNLVNDIITEVTNRGYIISRCNRTNFAVGQTIPVGLLSISATWVGSANAEDNIVKRSGEGMGSSVQKGGVEGQVVFFGFKLRCEVALTYEAQIKSLEIFEQKFVQQVADAMVEALEAAVVAGTGINQPKGVLLETPNAGKALEIANGAKLAYADAVKFVGAVPRKYRKDAVAFMTQNTFNEFMSIVDENGQPVAKVNSGVDGELVYRLFGMPVELADEYLEDYALNVEKDVLFAFIYNFKEYTINTNYDLGIKHKEDWDTEDKKIKAVMAADGKAVTKYSLVTFTKKAEAGI